jgi:hypothetical protein
MESNLKHSNDLYRDFKKLAEKYSEKMTIPEFIGQMSVYIAGAAYFCAPTLEEARKLLNNAIETGIQWQIKEENKS